MYYDSISLTLELLIFHIYVFMHITIAKKHPAASPGDPGYFLHMLFKHKLYFYNQPYS